MLRHALQPFITEVLPAAGYADYMDDFEYAAGLVQSISPGGAKGQFRPNAGEYLLDGRWDDAAPLAESRLRRRHERLGSASPWDARLGNAIGESGDVLTSLRELLVKYERWG